jgi:uncharacterized membrane-anchored protein
MDRNQIITLVVNAVVTIAAAIIGAHYAARKKARGNKRNIKASIKRIADKYLDVFIDVLMLLLSVFQIYRLIESTEPIRRIEIMFMSFFTLSTCFWARKLLDHSVKLRHHAADVKSNES